MTSQAETAWYLPAGELRKTQLARLNALLTEIRDRPFYRHRLAGIQLPLQSLDELNRIPCLNKSELLGASGGDAARIFDLPRCQYSRLHLTSGTSGHPLAVLDTSDDWRWWLDCWDHVLDAAEVTATDVAMMAFSFGPFIGFWTANDALIRRGVMVIPGGGMSSQQRLRMIAEQQCTVVCCTPTYALHLAGVASAQGIDLLENQVAKIIVAGEPGGSIATVRAQIENAWGAKVIDHAGASELGAWGFGSPDGRGLHVIETEFIVELLHFNDRYPAGVPAAPGETAELVLTNLGRRGGAAIRYRTGDMVRGVRDHDYPSPFLWLEGGVIGRADDMIVVRGVNVFPSSLEAIVREQEPTAEFRIILSRQDELDQIQIEVETDPATADQLMDLLRARLAMRVPVRCVPPGSLPTFEAKARRLVDHRVNNHREQHEQH
jgi:phenylacetate-CoA ligase